MVRVAVVVAGSFQYRGDAGSELMIPGSLLLGSPGQCFACGHAHGSGDRCLSFGYTPAYFERLAADAGVPPNFRQLRIPPLRELSGLVARACSALLRTKDARNDAPTTESWEELSIALGVQALLCAGRADGAAESMPESSVARVVKAVRLIDATPSEPHTLSALARECRLSLYHFLRVFRQVTGLTPHDYLVRTRIRDAASHLADGADRIVDVAFASGFGDVSNFCRAFRREMGMSPRDYRRQA